MMKAMKMLVLAVLVMVTVSWGDIVLTDSALTESADDFTSSAGYQTGSGGTISELGTSAESTDVIAGTYAIESSFTFDGLYSTGVGYASMKRVISGYEITVGDFVEASFNFKVETNDNNWGYLLKVNTTGGAVTLANISNRSKDYTAYWTESNMYTFTADQLSAVSSDSVITSIELQPRYLNVDATADPFDTYVPVDVYMDNMSITYVPEPATLGLIGLGGFAFLRRKKK